MAERSPFQTLCLAEREFLERFFFLRNVGTKFADYILKGFDSPERSKEETPSGPAGFLYLIHYNPFIGFVKPQARDTPPEADANTHETGA